MEAIMYRKIRKTSVDTGSARQRALRVARPACPMLSVRRDHFPWILFFPGSDRGGDGHLDALAPHMHGL